MQMSSKKLVHDIGEISYIIWLLSQQFGMELRDEEEPSLSRL
jgi:hypothetical protein